MKKILFVLIAASIFMIWSCKKTDDGLPTQEEISFVKTTLGEFIPGQYIVQLKDGATQVKSAKLSYADAQVMMVDEIQKVLNSSSISMREPIYVYTASVEGFTLKLADDEVKSLKENDAVFGIYQDQVITLAKPTPTPTPLPAQVTPWGISRVGIGTPPAGKKAWIIDTGIDLDHPDLNVRKDLGKSFVLRNSSPDDDNGHGTHCAGIVAAKNDEYGVVGVAPGAEVVPVKVLDKRGSGTISGVIAGVDYVAANAAAGDVVNMSLGGGISITLDEAVIKMAAKGPYIALAAGNESDNATNHSPARVEGDNVWTVSAFASGDKWAYFSNYGNPPIEFCAPGVSILSTYKGGQLATLSGTSMSAPHLCGILLVTNGNPKIDGYVSGDPDGNADPIAHK